MTAGLVWTARCKACDWTATGEHADRDAEKHTKATRHTTVTSARPVPRRSR